MTDISQVQPDPPAGWFDDDTTRGDDDSTSMRPFPMEGNGSVGNGAPCTGCAGLFDELAALRTMVVTIGEQNNWIVDTLTQFQAGFAAIQGQMSTMGPLAMVKAMVGGKKNGRSEA